MPNINEILDRIAHIKGYKTENKIAELFSVSPSTVSTWKLRNSIPYEKVIAFCEESNLSLDYVINGEGELYLDERGIEPVYRTRHYGPGLEDFTLVPKYKVRLSGGPGNYVLEEDMEHHLVFKTTWLKRRCPGNGCGLFTVTGDSMAPHVTEGDIVLVDMAKNQPLDIVDGKIYAFSEWETVKIKRLMRQGPKIMAQSDNILNIGPSMIEVDIGQFRLIGKIVWVGHEVR